MRQNFKKKSLKNIRKKIVCVKYKGCRKVHRDIRGFSRFGPFIQVSELRTAHMEISGGHDPVGPVPYAGPRVSQTPDFPEVFAGTHDRPVRNSDILNEFRAVHAFSGSSVRFLPKILQTLRHAHLNAAVFMIRCLCQ